MGGARGSPRSRDRHPGPQARGPHHCGGAGRGVAGQVPVRPEAAADVGGDGRSCAHQGCARRCVASMQERRRRLGGARGAHGTGPPRARGRSATDHRWRRSLDAGGRRAVSGAHRPARPGGPTEVGCGGRHRGLPASGHARHGHGRSPSNGPGHRRGGRADASGGAGDPRRSPRGRRGARPAGGRRRAGSRPRRSRGQAPNRSGVEGGGTSWR